MKSSKLIIGCLATLGLTAGSAVAQDDAEREAIAERLKPVGELCLQGEDCGTAMASSSGGGDTSSGGGSVDGEGIYNNVCMACHETGAAGAPVRGDEAAWSERTGKGFETLLSHSINGFNAMPAKGGNPNLSDAEMRAATAYLVEPVMDVPEQGGDEAQAEEAASGEEEDRLGEEQMASAEQDAASGEEQAAANGDAAASSEEEAAASDKEDAASGDEPAHAGIDGEAIYNQICMACHNTGAAGAPVRGNADQWADRMSKGMETLYDHSINGFNAMPAKGGNPNLSDDEVKAATDYLVEPVK
ncbi:MAG: c-type cytochrome [Halomonas sp.]|uniref:c-type cytochrome n=1 Tax=Halomonas sp. TaxID=1486246 RepID=UPI002ACE95C4|nr:c-type cytochrome [Halomonas sp.]MDZ7851542.1 c-type cytochrome [Halomonas sp.]